MPPIYAMINDAEKARKHRKVLGLGSNFDVAMYVLRMDRVRLTKDQVFAIQLKLMELYEHKDELTEQLIKAYWSMFSQYPAHIVLLGVNHVLEHHKYPRMPLPADFNFHEFHEPWLHLVRYSEEYLNEKAD